ncbi:hypothetical protein FRB98_000914, partial [Tulasnella sp. 332]
MSSERPRPFLLATTPALGHLRHASGIVRCELVKLELHVVFTVLDLKTITLTLTQELEQWPVKAGDL